MTTVQPSTPPTVAQLIKALETHDPNMPVVVSTHYDNGIGLGSDLTVYSAHVQPVYDGSFWGEYDPLEVAAAGEPQPHDGIRAVIIKS